MYIEIKPDYQVDFSGIILEAVVHCMLTYNLMEFERKKFIFIAMKLDYELQTISS